MAIVSGSHRDGKPAAKKRLRQAPGKVIHKEPGFYIKNQFEGDDEARKVLSDIHQLYQVESDKLWRSYRHRKKDRERRRAEALANPPEKKDVVLRFWKLDMEKRQQQQNHSR